MITQRATISSQAAASANVHAPGRRRITRWTKGVWTGLIAGTGLVVLEIVLLWGFGIRPVSEPIRLSASIALGNRAVAATAPFTFDIFFVGMLVHFIVSIWYAVVLGMIIRKLKVGMALTIGAAFGLAIYFLHFYGLTALYPWVANERGWIPIVSHVAFGISAAWVYSHLHMRQLAKEAKFILRR